MFRKLLSSVLAGTVIASSISSTIACRTNNFDSDYFLITDGGLLMDGSFNQNTYQGLTEYVQEKNPGKVPAYLEPSAGDVLTLKNYYKIAKVLGAKTVALVGFRQASPQLLETASNYFERSVIIDVGGLELPGNIATVAFQSEISGFEGSLAIMTYFTKLKTEHPALLPNNQIVGSTFGGQDNSASVDNYLFGMLAGLSFWNYVLSSQVKPYYNQLTALITAIGGDPKDQLTADLSGFQGELDKSGEFKSLSDQQNHWFSGTFAAQGGVSITKSLLAQTPEPNFMFPVAGPQTLDAINGYLANPNTREMVENKTARILGTDTDQALTYNTKINNNIIAVSAMKRLAKATKNILDDFTSDAGKTISLPDWSGTSDITGVSVAQNQAFQTKIDQLMGVKSQNPNDLWIKLKNFWNNSVGQKAGITWVNNILPNAQKTSQTNWGKFLAS